MNFFYFFAHLAFPFFTSGLIAFPRDFPISLTTASPSSWAAIAWSSYALNVFNSYKSSNAWADPPSSGLSSFLGASFLATFFGVAFLAALFGGALDYDR